VPNQVVAGIDTATWWNGIFGLGNQGVNFTGFSHPIDSYLTSLYKQGHIPSLTWGYTAGAKYRKYNLHFSGKIYFIYTPLSSLSQV